MINYVITMAGAGSRFRDAGYALPKWRLIANDKTLLEWSIDSLPLDICKKIIFIAKREEAIQYDLKGLIQEKYSHKLGEVYIHLIDQVTRGQAETTLFAREYLDVNSPIAIFNIDTRFTSHTLKENLLNVSVDGFMGAFTASEPRFSYARTNLEGYVIETAEKVVISNHALTGLYGFSKSESYFEAVEAAISHNRQEMGEYYVAPIYNTLINQGKKFRLDLAESVDILGTPSELDLFKLKTTCKSMAR
jgi:dTDP-glucose pyrophosphorylase